MNPIKHSWNAFKQSNRGVAAIEMAIMLPVFLLVLFGMIEYSRMILIQQKLDKTVAAMGDFITRGEFACSADMAAFRNVARDIMDPFDFTSGNIVFSSVVNYNNAIAPCAAEVACVSWQDGNGSRIGDPGTSPDRNGIGGLEIDQGQSYIITEVSFNYVPLLPASGNIIDALQPRPINLISIHKPRLGSLTQLDPAGKCGN
jgi:Flp pilus assembly protein TadG